MTLKRLLNCRKTVSKPKCLILKERSMTALGPKPTNESSDVTIWTFGFPRNLQFF